jgi:wobble nucleotide-excising tRNase
MIKKIQQIKNFGFFSDYTPLPELYDFERYNLIYGWNGSGKSTLSKLLYTIIDKKLPAGCESAHYSLFIDNNVVESQDIQNNSLKIQIFNEQFVEDNIDWNNIVKCLLYVSKGKVEDKTKLIEASKEIQKIRTEIESLNENINSTSNEIEGFLTDTGRLIKKQFEVLKTNDSRYINYNKGKLRSLIQDHNELKKKKTSINENKIEELRSIAKLELLDSINITLPEKIQTSLFEETHNKIVAILSTNFVSKTIDSLKNDKIISSWVEQGIIIHEQVKYCKFCGNEISDSRKALLNGHFNNNYKQIKQQTVALLEVLSKLKVSIDILPQDLSIYPFLKERIHKENLKLRGYGIKINSYIERLENALNNKLSNLFDLSIKIGKFQPKDILNYNSSLLQLNEIFGLHNNTTENFDSKTNEAKEKLEIIFAHRELTGFKYFEKLKIIEKNQNKVISDKESCLVLQDIIYKLEASLTDEVLGAAEFNTKLHRFLNHNDISLEFDKANKGYKIIRKRGTKKEIAKNLSEGEKTAISFVFFMTKLQEDKENLKKSIVVIDDPISSFDSNHLFNAYSYIRNICNDVHQLIILTHNFMFFRLIRDWIKEKDKKRKDAQGNQYIEYNCRIFCLNAEYVSGIRQAQLCNADDSLLQYNSEYHFLFSKLYSFQDNRKLKIEDCFLMSNIARKVLEIFLNFKFPKKRNDFMAMLDTALPNEKDKILKEKIYRFINKYSHGDRIESFDSTIDNVLSESDNIAKDVLTMIKKLDKKHYEELIEVVSN